MDFGVGVTWKKEIENYVNIEFMYEKEKITLLKTETWKETEFSEVGIQMSGKLFLNVQYP